MSNVDINADINADIKFVDRLNNALLDAQNGDDLLEIDYGLFAEAVRQIVQDELTSKIVQDELTSKKPAQFPPKSVLDDPHPVYAKPASTESIFERPRLTDLNDLAFRVYNNQQLAFPAGLKADATTQSTPETLLGRDIEQETRKRAGFITTNADLLTEKMRVLGHYRSTLERLVTEVAKQVEKTSFELGAELLKEGEKRV